MASSSPVVGVLRITLHLPASTNLKAKRQVTAGLLRRVRSRYQVAVAEVGHGDRWQLTELVVACVSGDRRHADEVLSHVLRFVEAESTEAMITDVSTELLTL
jgi:uncharacterized protein YlxP (DUF503 family)